MLTLEDLKEMEPGIFSQGETIDGPGGVNMSNSGQILKWVAVRGQIHDWAIYIGLNHLSFERIAAVGDKVSFAKHITQLVPCDVDSFKMYRY